MSASALAVPAAASTGAAFHPIADSPPPGFKGNAHQPRRRPTGLEPGTILLPEEPPEQPGRSAFLPTAAPLVAGRKSPAGSPRSGEQQSPTRSPTRSPKGSPRPKQSQPPPPRQRWSPPPEPPPQVARVEDAPSGAPAAGSAVPEPEEEPKAAAAAAEAAEELAEVAAEVAAEEEVAERTEAAEAAAESAPAEEVAPGEATATGESAPEAAAPSSPSAAFVGASEGIDDSNSPPSAWSAREEPPSGQQPPSAGQQASAQRPGLGASGAAGRKPRLVPSRPQPGDAAPPVATTDGAAPPPSTPDPASSLPHDYASPSAPIGAASLQMPLAPPAPPAPLVALRSQRPQQQPQPFAEQASDGGFRAGGGRRARPPPPAFGSGGAGGGVAGDGDAGGGGGGGSGSFATTHERRPRYTTMTKSASLPSLGGMLPAVPPSLVYSAYAMSAAERSRSGMPGRRPGQRGGLAPLPAPPSVLAPAQVARDVADFYKPEHLGGGKAVAAAAAAAEAVAAGGIESLLAEAALDGTAQVRRKLARSGVQLPAFGGAVNLSLGLEASGAARPSAHGDAGGGGGGGGGERVSSYAGALNGLGMPSTAGVPLVSSSVAVAAVHGQYPRSKGGKKGKRRSAWAKKRGYSGVTMQERLLAEARRRIALQTGGAAAPKPKTINLGAIAKALVNNRRVIAAFRASEELGGLSEVQMAMLAYGGRPMKLKRYGVLYREGASAQSFYVLMSGALQQASRTDGYEDEAIRVEKGSPCGYCFGCESISGANLKRHSTLLALENCELVVFSTKDIAIDSEGIEALAEKALASAAEDALRATPLFKDLPPEALTSVAPLFEFETAEQDEVIFSTGGPPDKMYVLLNGSIEIFKVDFSIAVLDASVGDFGGHPFFGATSLITESTRPWDVVSLTPSNMLVLTAPKFKTFLRKVPDFKQRLADFTAARARQWELQMPVSLKDMGRSTEKGAQRRGSLSLSRRSSTRGGNAAEVSDEDLESLVLIQASVRGMLTRKNWQDREQLMIRREYEASPARKGSVMPPQVDLDPAPAAAPAGPALSRGKTSSNLSAVKEGR